MEQTYKFRCRVPAIPEWSFISSNQQELAGRSLLDQAQEPDESTAGNESAQMQTQHALENVGSKWSCIWDRFIASTVCPKRSQARCLNWLRSKKGTLALGKIGADIDAGIVTTQWKCSAADQVVNSLKEYDSCYNGVEERKEHNQLRAVFPNISDTVNSYHRFNLFKSLERFGFHCCKYSKAGGDMGGLLSQIEQSLDLQNQSNQSVSTMTGVRIPSMLEPVVRLMQQVSHDIRVVSEGSNTIETMKQAGVSESKRSAND